MSTVMFFRRFTQIAFLSLALVPAAANASGFDLESLEKMAASGTPQEMEAALSRAEVSADVVFPSGNGPLHVAAEHASDPAMIDVLVKHGAPLSGEGLERLTPLMLAAAYNPSAAVADALIRAGADVNAADGQGRTPLHLAAASNESPETAAALLRHGAAPNARDKNGRTPLWVAANRSDARAVLLLLGAGAKVNEPDNDGVTPLLAASEKPDAALLRMLTGAGADANVRGKNRYTPLMTAVAAGADARAVRALTAGGADAEAEDDRNRSAIHIFASRRPDAQNGSPENQENIKRVLDALINAGANPNAMDSNLTTPLMEACKHGNAVMAGALLKAGASAALRDRASMTPLLHAASEGAPLEIYELLKGAGADMAECTRKGDSALMVAIEFKAGADGIKALLDAGADPNYQRHDTVTALMEAVADYGAELAENTKNTEIAEILLERGADPNLSTWDGLSPMMLAAQRVDDTEVFDALAAAGADVNSRSGQGISALMVAATSGNTAAAERLIALGADVRLKDLDGFTALDHAVQAGEENEGVLDMIELLIAEGSDVNTRDFSGTTPVMRAALDDSREILDMLMDAGADPDAADTVGWTALHFAARASSGETLSLFIERMSGRNASVDVPDNGGTTPLMVAASYDNAAAVRLLLAAGASFSMQDKTGRSAYEYAVMKNADGALEAIKEAMERPREEKAEK